MSFERDEVQMGNYPGKFEPGQWACAAKKCTWGGKQEECLGLDMHEFLCPRCKKGECFPCEDGEWPQVDDSRSLVYNKD